MEEEANQLYRRPKMTGQVRDEEEEEEDCLSTILSRYLNRSTCSSGSLSKVIGLSQVALSLRNFVLRLLIFNPTCAEIRPSSFAFANCCDAVMQGHLQRPQGPYS